MRAGACFALKEEEEEEESLTAGSVQGKIVMGEMVNMG